MNRTSTSPGEEKCASRKEPGSGKSCFGAEFRISKRRVSDFTRRSGRKSGYSGSRMGFLGVLTIERALASQRLTPRMVQLSKAGRISIGYTAEMVSRWSFAPCMFMHHMSVCVMGYVIIILLDILMNIIYTSRLDSSDLINHLNCFWNFHNFWSKSFWSSHGNSIVEGTSAHFLPSANQARLHHLDSRYSAA